nr:glycine cleavage T C-terminal barrel domain-containing protein [Brachybacterium sillae]
MTTGTAGTPIGPTRLPLFSVGAVLGDGPDAVVPVHYGAPLREQRRLLAGRAVVDLGQMEVLEVRGADRLTWLTTVTSQVLTDLAPGESRALTVLSPQGRVEHLAAAAPLTDDPDALLLITDAGGRAGLLRYLTMMRFAARVEFRERDDLRVLGAVRPAAEVLREDTPPAVAVWRDPWPGVVPGGVAYGPDPDEVTDWVLTVVEDAAARRVDWSVEQLAGMAAAEALRIARHQVRAARDLDDRTIPHEVDLLRTAVHTAKGCYRGQETVAKVLNLGQPPRRLVMLHLDGSQDLPPRPGGRVLLGQKEVGTVTSTAIHADLGPIALALVRRALPLEADVVVEIPTGVETADGGDPAVLQVDARQEAAVLPRDHGPRPATARL